MSIEEAWAAIDIVQPNEVRNEYNRRQKECARALALAVLEEAIHSGNCVLRMIGEDPIMDGHDLRRRIEALP